jgi:hypothetical protein
MSISQVDSSPSRHHYLDRVMAMHCGGTQEPIVEQPSPAEKRGARPVVAAHRRVFLAIGQKSTPISTMNVRPDRVCTEAAANGPWERATSFMA